MAGYTLHGRLAFQRRSRNTLMRVSARVTLRRLFGRKLVPSWPWVVEVSTEFLREQMRYMATLPIAEAREYEDSLVFDMPSLKQVAIAPADGCPVPGRWFTPKAVVPNRTLLYFHGGGYAYAARAHDNLVALVAAATGARTFALDYRLTPEHPYPAQQDDAIAAYRWLLAQGIAPSRLVLGGDSAGGNLLLTTLVALRDAGDPLPALALGICPWTDTGHRGASLMGNNPYDWIEGQMALTFGEWFRGGLPANDPRVSPIYAKLHGLPPLVLQAGGREILHDMIVDFADVAKQQGVEVDLQVWPDMNHDFQAFGDMLPEAQEALRKLRQAVDARLG